MDDSVAPAPPPAALAAVAPAVPPVAPEGNFDIFCHNVRRDIFELQSLSFSK